MSEWVSIDVTFAFVYDDDTPVNIEYLYMTFLDIDGSQDGMETIRLHGINLYKTVDPDTTITDGADWVQVENHFSSAGSNVDNPTDIDNLTAEQISVAIMAQWTNVDSFQATLTMDNSFDTNRFMMFSGPK